VSAKGRQLRLWTCATAACCFVAMAAPAQDFLTTVQFSLSNPGARSLGLGGAFLALADDATAAFANPAGLVQLTEPEVSLEGRAWSYSTPFTLGGRAAGQPTGLGIDITANAIVGSDSVGLGGISFLSVVFPLGRWTIALYGHQMANFESSFETQSIFITDPNGDVAALLPRRGGADVEATSYGAAVGMALTERLSLGLALSLLDTDVKGVTDVYFPDEALAPDLLGPIYFGPSTFDPQNSFITASVEGSDTAMALSGGLLWTPGSGWRFAAVYREGPTVGGGINEIRAGAFHPQPIGTILSRTSGSVSLPDVFGVGVARRFVRDHLTVSLEWDRVEYADLIEDDDLQSVANGTEIHLGLEYALLQTRPVVAFRLGAWLDPDHTIRVAGDNALLAAFFPPGKDTIHFAAGLGVAAERFQIDLGLDLSELRDTVSLSALYRFGRP